MNQIYCKNCKKWNVFFIIGKDCFCQRCGCKLE